jgi:hypothetical protein
MEHPLAHRIPIINIRIGVPNSKIATTSVLPIYIGLFVGFQIGIRRGARSIQMKTGFVKHNFNFEKSQELKGRSEKFKTPYW